jgi:hypothetical protein
MGHLVAKTMLRSLSWQGTVTIAETALGMMAFSIMTLGITAFWITINKT